MIKTFKQDKIYIVKHITKELNKFVLLYIIHILFNSKTVLTVMTILNNSQIQIHEFA